MRPASWAPRACTDVCLVHLRLRHPGPQLVASEDSSPVKNQALTKADAVSTVPSKIHGDWVLFHPVYTAEELKAVEVCPQRVMLGSIIPNG
jgi:hypothetical protein